MQSVSFDGDYVRRLADGDPQVEQRLTFEILSQKLDLFGKVLDSSDAILHVPANNFPQSLISGIGFDFEAQLRRIYDQARSIDDVTHELQGLRAEIEAKREEFDAEQSRAAELVEERLDDTLRAVFRKYEHELPGELWATIRGTSVGRSIWKTNNGWRPMWQCTKVKAAVQ